MAAFLVVNSNLSVRLIAGIVQKYMTKAGLAPLYVQVIFQDGIETERTLVVCDAKIAHLFSRELNIDILDPKVVVTDEAAARIQGFVLTLPTSVPLGAVQSHLLTIVGNLACWFGIEHTALKLTYPGSSRMRDSHGGQALLEVNKQLDAQNWETMRFILEHTYWPFLPAETPHKELFFQLKWRMLPISDPIAGKVVEKQKEVPKLIEKPKEVVKAIVDKKPEPKPLVGWAEKVKNNIPSRIMTKTLDPPLLIVKQEEKSEEEDDNPYGVKPAVNIDDG